MKRKCKILQALFLYAMVTMPRIAVAANPSGVILNPEQVRALDSKLQSKTIQANGLSLSSDREAILKAVKNLNGNAIVDFSSGKSDSQDRVVFKDKQHASGVLIGSGSDGLVVQNNYSPGSPIIVQAPSLSISGITVTGNMAPDQTEKVCVFTYSGEVTSDHGRSLREIQCGDIGSEILLKPGRYLILVGYDDQVSKSQPGVLQRVVLEPGEHKIIPLREITISNGTKGLDYILRVDYKDNPEALRNFLYLTKPALENNSFIVPSKVKLDENGFLRVVTGQGDMSLDDPTWYFFNWFEPDEVISRGETLKSPKIAVLPGIYRISWYLKDSNQILDSTRGIVIE